MAKSSATEAKKKRVPPWVGEYFRQAYDSLERLIQVIQVSRRGIAGIQALPRLTKALAKVEGKEEDPNRAKLVEEDAALAKSEVEKDFPVLHALAVVALWSWLEHLIKGLLAESLVKNPKHVQAPSFNKLKVKLSDYLPLNKREQAAYLVELLEQETSATLKRGINRFESLLAPLSLSGEVSDITARAIFELQQVRNAIVHQNGRCDRRLRSSCPWLKIKVGAQITIGAEQLDVYSHAIGHYALDVLYRIGDQHGVNLRQDEGDT